MNRDVELQHLAAADAYVARAECIVSEQAAKVEILRERGYDTALAEQTLRTFDITLQTLRDHRDVIIRTIAQIDQDRLC